MSFLRKEYKEKKQQSAEAVNEAAVAWLAENVILITERIDTKTVSRLVTSIQKFEDTFGQFRDRLPSIGSMLDSAENALSMVITGKLNDKKTANLLLQFSYLYSTMSEFFSRDLPVLLMTKMFAIAKQNPDTTMNTLRVLSTGGPGSPIHNANLIHDAFVTALTPSKDERRLLKKLYRSTPLPEFDIERIAAELIRLSYSDLEELTKVGRIPMVAVPETPAEQPAEPTTEQPVQPGAVANTQQPAVPEGVQYTSSKLIESVNNGTILLENMSDDDFDRLLEESKMLLTEETAEQVTKSLTNLKNIVDKVDAFEGLKAPVNGLYSKAIKTLTDPGVAAFLKQKLGKNKLAKFFTSQQGMLVAQANLAIETFNSIAKAYKSAIQLFDQKEVIEKEDIENMRKLLTNAATGGIVGRISSFFKTAPYKGLEPKTIVDTLIAPLVEALAQSDQETAADADVQQAIDRGEEGAV
jgi:hypothetical protein